MGSASGIWMVVALVAVGLAGCADVSMPGGSPVGNVVPPRCQQYAPAGDELDIRGGTNSGNRRQLMSLNFEARLPGAEKIGLLATTDGKVPNGCIREDALPCHWEGRLRDGYSRDFFNAPMAFEFAGAYRLHAWALRDGVVYVSEPRLQPLEINTIINERDPFDQVCFLDGPGEGKDISQGH